MTDAPASRILFEGRRAVGVEYRHGDSTRTALANREVLIAGGAFNSPQLLQLSGLGPAALLSSLGMSAVASEGCVLGASALLPASYRMRWLALVM